MNKQFAGVAVGVAGLMCSMAGTLCAADQENPADYYTEERIYQTRPNLAGERFFGVIGPTGLKARAYPGVILKVEEIFFPQFILGYLGMPRRYHVYPEEFQELNVFSTAGATILGIGYLIPLTYLIWSLRHGELAPANPRGATGLEWQTSSPPPTENFPRTPVVTAEAYDYEHVLTTLPAHPKEAAVS